MLDSQKPTTEAVDVCPHCEHENVYPEWDAQRDGYVARCQECGKLIMLCDECLHADDNAGGMCDWRELNGEGICFRRDSAGRSDKVD